MSDYHPAGLSRKWLDLLAPLLRETQELWKAGRPKKRLFSFGLPERDAQDDTGVPAESKAILLYQGQVVWGLIARAFFAAYLPGRKVHYGSVVYSLDPHEPDSIFELAWRVNQLREPGAVAPAGTEHIAAAIRNDRSGFSKLKLPVELDAFGTSYFANLCIHRSRLPGGYLHDRLLPILVSPEQTAWCTILPLRFWAPQLKELWLTGPSAYAPSQFSEIMKQRNIEP